MSTPSKEHNNAKTLIFMVVLCVTCALILSTLASALKKPQEQAIAFDRSKQMLIASQILSHSGEFKWREGNRIMAAHLNKAGQLEEGEGPAPEKEDILKVFDDRIEIALVDEKGELKTFEEAGIDPQEYLLDNQKMGYAKLPLKLIYKILPPQSEKNKKMPEGYVIPINGYGLWGPIYGYLAVSKDGDTVIGTSWYQHIETPGLGAVISEAHWQDQFLGKTVFQRSPNGKYDVKSSPLGLVVVKGKVADVYNDSPKASSAIDGISGATITGTGVTNAYKDVLAYYRPFLVKLNEKNAKKR